jgi:hypothetical protein
MTSIEQRIDEIKKLVDYACMALSVAVRERRRRIVPQKTIHTHRILGRLEKKLRRPLTEYVAYGRQDSIEEARDIVIAAVNTLRAKH